MSTRQFVLNVTSAQLPAWSQGIPANSIRTIGASYGANLLSSQNQTVDVDFSNAGVLGDYCGVIYAATLGSYGSIIAHGGGHGGRRTNEVYRYDVQTALWSRMTEPAWPLYVRTPSAGINYVFDARQFGNTGDQWAAADFSSVHAGQLCATHTYANCCWGPPGSFGNDPGGYYFLPSVSEGVYTGSADRPHYLPLANARNGTTGWGNWVRGPTSHATAFGSNGHTLYDSLRNRMVSADYSQVGMLRITNCADMAVSQVSLNPWRDDSTNFVSAYDSANDLYMFVSAMRGGKLQLVRPGASAPYAQKTVTINNNLLGGAKEGGWDWVQSKGCWVYYPEAGGNVLKILRRPADPWNDPWTMEQITLALDSVTGDTGFIAAIPSYVAPHHNRCRYIPALDLFLWVSHNTYYVQAFKVTL